MFIEPKVLQIKHTTALVLLPLKMTIFKNSNIFFQLYGITQRVQQSHHFEVKYEIMRIFYVIILDAICL